MEQSRTFCVSLTYSDANPDHGQNRQGGANKPINDNHRPLRRPQEDFGPKHIADIAGPVIERALSKYTDGANRE